MIVRAEKDRVVQTKRNCIRTRQRERVIQDQCGKPNRPGALEERNQERPDPAYRELHGIFLERFLSLVHAIEQPAGSK